MPTMDGVTATATATAGTKRRWPDVEVVAVTSFVEGKKMRAAVERALVDARLPTFAHGVRLVRRLAGSPAGRGLCRRWAVASGSRGSGVAVAVAGPTTQGSAAAPRRSPHGRQPSPPVLSRLGRGQGPPRPRARRRRHDRRPQGDLPA